MKKTGVLLRIIASPFVLGLILIAYILGAFKRWVQFLKYGGEWINYDKDETVTIQKIYEEIRDSK